MSDLYTKSREYIDKMIPECLPKVCPLCGGKIQIFGLGPNGKADYSHTRTICWGNKCGKRTDYAVDIENNTYTEIEEKK